jgi:hypothetical protein
MRHLLPLLALLPLAACAANPTTKPDATSTQTASLATDALLAACNDAAQAARVAIDAEAQAAPSADAAGWQARWSAMTALRDQWRQDMHPCQAPGPKTTERAQTHDDVMAALNASADSVIVRGTTALRDADLTQAFALLRARYATGEPASDAIRESAAAVTRRMEDALMQLMQAAKAWSRTGEGTTAVTCVTARAALDPKSPPHRDFSMLIEGTGDVHVLCLSPLPGDKFAGDPDGQIVITLVGNDGAPVVTSLGQPEKWTNTRYFRARFGLPQGIGKAATAAYTVTLSVKRPKLGDEQLATGQFLWHK